MAIPTILQNDQPVSQSAPKPGSDPEKSCTISRFRKNVRVPIRPGRRQYDWIRLVANQKQKGTRMPTSTFSMEEVRRHCVREDCWMVLGGVVFDVTKYLPFHPGSPDEIMRAAGEDGTQLFVDVHAYVNVAEMLSPFILGKVVPWPPEPPKHRGPDSPFLHPDVWETVEVEQVTTACSAGHGHAVKIRLKTPEDRSLGLRCGEHVRLGLELTVRNQRKMVWRAYTPVSPPSARGYVDVVVRAYQGGTLSPRLAELKPGNEVQISGPFGGLLFDSPRGGSPTFHVGSVRTVVPRGVLAVAAGTGITPLYSTIRSVLGVAGGAEEEVSSGIPVRLLYFCYAPGDVLLGHEIRALQDTLGCNLHVDYVFSHIPEDEDKSLPNTSSVHPYNCTKTRVHKGPFRRELLEMVMDIPSDASEETDIPLEALHVGSSDSSVSSKHTTPQPIAAASSSKESLVKIGSATDTNTFVLVCGPPAFNARVEDTLVTELGVKAEDVYIF